MVPRLIVDAGAGDFLACLRLLSSATAEDRHGIDDRLTALARRAGRERAAVAGLSLRTLFDALLQILAEKGSGEILFSAATIEDMPALAAIAGFRVTPVDLNLETMIPDAGAVSEAIGPDTKALVVAQLYGCRADLSAVGEACRRRGVLLIEDIAQSFDGAYLGSPHSDFVLLSFGPIKRFTAFGGGILLAARAEFADAVRRRINAYPMVPRSKFLRRALKMFALRVCAWRPLYSAVWSAIRLGGKNPDDVIGKLARGFSGERPGVFRYRPAGALLAFMAYRFENALTGQDGTRVTRAMAARTAKYRGSSVPGGTVAGMGEWIFPVVTDKPDRLVAFLNSHGYDATRGTTSMRPVEASGSQQADHPSAAARLLGKAVYLPVHSLRSDSEFGTLLRLVDEGSTHHTRT